MNNILQKLVDGNHLSEEEASLLLESIIAGELPPTRIAAILIALRMKGEGIDEIVGFVRTMRKHMLAIKAPGAVDLAGTGGDGSGTFNVSTAASFVVAGAGTSVAKHGNRAASSKCGSADVLEALGVVIALSPAEAEKVLHDVGMVFLFAPNYHPAMKLIGPVRKELGVRTVFNFLGPFLNPAGTKRQLMGVPTPELGKKLADVAARLEYERLLIVSSEDGLDEITTTAKTQVFEVAGTAVRSFDIAPEEFGISRAQKETLVGGDAKANAEILRAILSGEKGPRRDIVLMNAGAALYAAGKAPDIKEGIALAARSIDTGAATKVLDALVAATKSYAPKA